MKVHTSTHSLNRGCYWSFCDSSQQSKRVLTVYQVNSLRPRPNRRHFADDIFKCISLIENASIPIKFSLKYVPRGPINNIPALVQIMAWRRPGDKPLSEPMMDSLPTHICVTRPQWVKGSWTLPLTRASPFWTIRPLVRNRVANDRSNIVDDVDSYACTPLHLLGHLWILCAV